MTKKYVLTGSAWSGKTSVINALAREKFVTVPEAATLIISEQLTKGGNLLPWTNLDYFLEVLIEKQLALEAQIPAESTVAFIDRGIPDELAYFKYRGIKPTPVYEKAFREHRYETTVFLLEALPGYRQDQIRREPLEMVQKLRSLHQEAYTELGYEVTKVPLLPVEERVKFVLERI